MSMENHISLLGLPARDRVTGQKGIITSVCFDLYGCIQAVITPAMDDDGKLGEQRWFDIARLEATSEERVMPVPDFIERGSVADGLRGSAEKPAFI